MDILEEEEMEKIQTNLNHFILHNEAYINPRKNWITEDMLYAPKSEGGFNVIKIKDFFNSIKTSWIRRYIAGLDDHWADMLDERLNCNIETRDNLLKLGAEHPKITKIIDLKLPGISSFIASYQRTNRAFHGCKEAGDNRWLNGPVFYNSTILRNTGPIKKRPELQRKC